MTRSHDKNVHAEQLGGVFRWGFLPFVLIVALSDISNWPLLNNGVYISFNSESGNGGTGVCVCMHDWSRNCFIAISALACNAGGGFEQNA